MSPLPMYSNEINETRMVRFTRGRRRRKRRWIWNCILELLEIYSFCLLRTLPFIFIRQLKLVFSLSINIFWKFPFKSRAKKGWTSLFNWTIPYFYFHFSFFKKRPLSLVESLYRIGEIFAGDSHSLGFLEVRFTPLVSSRRILALTPRGNWATEQFFCFYLFPINAIVFTKRKNPFY